MTSENGGKSRKEETHSLINYSGENLAISQSNLEKGFTKNNKNLNNANNAKKSSSWGSIVWAIGIIVGFTCLALQICQLKSSYDNSWEIAKLTKEVENLKHRILANDIMNALKTLEFVLNMETEDNDDTGVSEDFDYKNYDLDDEEQTNEGSLDNKNNSDNWPLIYGSKSSDFSAVIESTESTTSGQIFNEDVLGLLKEVQSKNRQEFSDNSGRRNYNLNARDAKNERKANEKEGTNEGKINAMIDGNRTIKKRDTNEERISNSSYQETRGKQARDFNADSLDAFENDEDDSDLFEDEISRSHPPKKYKGRQNVDESTTISLTHRNLSEQSRNSAKHINRQIHRINDMREGKKLQNSWQSTREPHRIITRRHLRAPRQVFAVHYGADYSMMAEEDEHTGNGRARHNEGIFKAWRASDWVNDFGMNRYFNLANDGKLTVHEAGLYIFYAQIHYLDEHDENGFHLLVNGLPVVQCMVYSPGTGHKSRSCFSAQMIYLQSGDRLILQDVSPGRYTLFQKDKSFFGLVKVGDFRQQKQHSTQTQSPQ